MTILNNYNRMEETKRYQYMTEGTCSRAIEIEMQGGKVADVRFYGGCNGNLQGIAALVKGMTPEQVIEKLEGIKCGAKDTSCPDQLSRAMREIMKENA